MKIALEKAKIAYSKDEVPIGCVIVKDNEIIASAYNRKELDNIATYHAEIIAINEACKKLKTWHLEDCAMYTTVEPCMMCTGAIIQSRISKVVYGTKNESFGYLSKVQNSKIEIIGNILDIECSQILTKFFKKKRGTSD
jgi:tRNA(adenine34) deaminase